jgi:hypothetical protein
VRAVLLLSSRVRPALRICGPSKGRSFGRFHRGRFAPRRGRGRTRHGRTQRHKLVVLQVKGLRGPGGAGFGGRGRRLAQFRRRGHGSARLLLVPFLLFTQRLDTVRYLLDGNGWIHHDHTELLKGIDGQSKGDGRRATRPAAS